VIVAAICHPGPDIGRLNTMPSISWNQEVWGQQYAWDKGGEEWSKRWGGSLSQWRSCIWPRIAAFLPAASIVEIAPGYGRWTHYLLPHCETYTGIDLSERCVDICRERFAGTAARFAVGDGRSLPEVPDGSTDFVFSFDSLVHCEADVIADYLREIGRVLTAGGAAFIHHSNLGRYRASARVRDAGGSLAARLPARKDILRVSGVLDWDHRRGRSVTAGRFAQMARDAGLSCISQEIITWNNSLLTDCFSAVTRPGSRWDRVPVVSVNRLFLPAARSAGAAARAFPQVP